MSIVDDIFNLEDHFKDLVDNPDKISTANKDERCAVRDAWERVCVSHGEGELLAMKVEPIINGFAAVLQAYDVVRAIPKTEEDKS